MRLHRLALVAIFAVSTPVDAATPCHATDYMAVPIPVISEHPELQAIQLAYPSVKISSDGKKISIDGIYWLDVGHARDLKPSDRLEQPNIIEQFIYKYPLSMDLHQRNSPYNDPGRLRNEELFQELYFKSEKEAEKSLVKVEVPEVIGESLWVTEKHGVACQLSAAFEKMKNLNQDFREFFQNVGGGFNWRIISGTSRLSAHSYGIAIDINPHLGKYWKWTGSIEGAVPSYHNEIPESLVSTMEKYGFIWGGKWHHFDGMHFEYRPEIILYSRMTNY